MKTSLWLNVDPKSDKYPNISPYTYCFNNPMNVIDPDGKEPKDPPHCIFAFFTEPWKRTADDKRIVKNFYSLKANIKDNALRFFGHGYNTHLKYEGNLKEPERYNTPEKVDQFLSQSEEGKKWKELKEKGGTFIPYGCSTGAEGGIIQQTSANEKMSKIIFVAPTQFVHPSLDTDSGNVYTFNGKKTGGMANIHKW